MSQLFSRILSRGKKVWIFGLVLVEVVAAHGTPEKALGLIITGQWDGDAEETLNDFREDVVYSREGILGQNEAASAWIASSTVLLKWIGFKEYVDLAGEIETSYGYLDPDSLRADWQAKTAILMQQKDDWAGWINAALMARALRMPDQAVVCLENAGACPTCVDSPGLHALRGKCFLESSNLPAARVEYASAIAMASETNNSSFVFRMRQMYVDDFYDRGHLDEALDIGYGLCMDSSYPLERAWAHAMNIVYLWSRDDLSGIQDSVQSLSAVLSDATPQSDSQWEQKRFAQIQFLQTTAGKALLDDQLSSMILDVEATDFHYKMGELDRAMARLKHWIEAYPISEYPNLTDEEKEWSLWSKYNYAVMLCGFLRLQEAEEILRSVIETVPNGENENLLSLSWCTLGQALNLEGRKEESLEAFEMGLQLDASDIRLIPENVSDLLQQPYIEGGKLPDGCRASFIHEYQQVLTGSTGYEGGN